MARKLSADYLKQCRMRIETSRKWRKEDGYDATWKRMNDMYRGKQFDLNKSEDRIMVNIAFSTMNVISPSISVNYPKITVNANNPNQAAQAIIAEAVVNYWWKHNDIRLEFRRAVKDMLAFGHGWIKVGYRFVEEEAVAEGDTEVSDPQEGGESTANTVILEDAPFAERVSVNDVFVDPDATSMRDIRWIAQRIRRPINDVKADKRYSKAARNDVTMVAVSRYADDPTRKKVYDKSQSYAEVWEFYDIAANTMSIFSDGGENFLVKPMAMPYAFGQPFVMLRNYDIPDHFYPIGDLETVEPLQNELNETRSQMMNHRKKFSRKYLYRESAFDNLGKSALESDDDNVMVPVNGDEALSGVVSAFPAVINPPEFYNQSQMIINDFDRISGVSEFQRGSQTEIRRTATESSLIQDAANARTADKLAVVEQGISEVAKRLVMLSQQFMIWTQVARVMGKDGEPLWVQYDRDYLKGDFDFEVVGGSTQPQNESFRRQMALQIVDAMTPFAGAGIVDMTKLASFVLQQGFGIKNPSEFMAQAQPMAPEGVPPVPAGQVPPPGPAGQPPEEGGLPPEIVAMLQAQQQGQAPEQPQPPR